MYSVLARQRNLNRFPALICKDLQHNDFVKGIFWSCSFLTTWTLKCCTIFRLFWKLVKKCQQYSYQEIYLAGNADSHNQITLAPGRKMKERERIQLHALERKKKEGLVQFWAVWPASPFSARGLDGEQQFQKKHKTGLVLQLGLEPGFCSPAFTMSSSH